MPPFSPTPSVTPLQPAQCTTLHIHTCLKRTTLLVHSNKPGISPSSSRPLSLSLTYSVQRTHSTFPIVNIHVSLFQPEKAKGEEKKKLWHQLLIWPTRYEWTFTSLGASVSQLNKRCCPHGWDLSKPPWPRGRRRCCLRPQWNHQATSNRAQILLTRTS